MRSGSQILQSDLSRSRVGSGGMRSLPVAAVLDLNEKTEDPLYNTGLQ